MSQPLAWDDLDEKLNAKAAVDPELAALREENARLREAPAEARRQALKEVEGIARAELSDWRGSTGGIERIVDAIAALAASPKTGE